MRLVTVYDYLNPFSGTLQLRDLVTELSEVAYWFHRGLQLGVSFPKLMCCVQRSTSPHESCGKIYMLRERMDRMGSKASWAHIVAALVMIKMAGLAQRLSDKYGMNIYNVIYVVVRIN